MHLDFKPHERELIKIVNHFRKKAITLIENGKLGQEHKEVINSCHKLIDKIQEHASVRNEILSQRDKLKVVIQDNASCPQCHSGSMLKFNGMATSDQGWKSNKYRCRKCNIEFTWNRPNNPWDFLSYIDEFKKVLDAKLLIEQDEESKQGVRLAMDNLMEIYHKLKPMVEQSDVEFKALEEQEKEMARQIKDFKNYLLIEKIRMDSLED